MSDSSVIKKAHQGVRQLLLLTDKTKKILKPGDTFRDFNRNDQGVCTDAVTLHLFEIQPKTIGIIHETNSKGVSTVSIVWDDCKAARKALRDAESNFDGCNNSGAGDIKKDISVDHNNHQIKTVRVYSEKESTEKKYTVAFAVEQARSILRNKHKTNLCCVTSVRKRNPDDLITVVDVNEIIDSIVFDTVSDSF